ncbi:NmrA family NAD(P)-binding protein [Rossellomorea aquimaris]|uniref:SDR family oxidoreductase n=1 Tax=Rossellomorea aquimaris TaxID=189382 RepID=UPI001CD33EB0|nr:NmrA family NAD(P)-binding protein [Rossellomorea aquimaris]MCA1054091.1 NmrA family NAD(P)-binding protein [Rossellomorea aquimaris]
MKILVTGGTGVLGSSFASLAEREGYQVLRASRTQPASVINWTFLDLMSGEGLSEALSGVDVVFHAATSPAKNTDKVDIAGTLMLLEECKKVGLKHFIYPSIVGIDSIPLNYYKAKLTVEDRIVRSGVPYTIMRVTQFHNLLEKMIGLMAKYPIIFLPTTLIFQPVDVEEVAEAFLEIVNEGPLGKIDDFAGPEILSLKDMYTSWRAHHGVKNILIPLPYLPSKTFKAFRDGNNTNQNARKGERTWEWWLEKRR